jgi:WD domain, G-beta repeat
MSKVQQAEEVELPGEQRPQVSASTRFTFELDPLLFAKSREQQSVSLFQDSRPQWLRAREQCYALTHDGKVLFTAGFIDGSIRASSVSKSKCVATLTGHIDCVVALSLDGPVLVSGSLDTRCRLWRLNISEGFAVEDSMWLLGHTCPISAVCVRYSLDTCASLSSNGLLLLHSLAGVLLRRVVEPVPANFFRSVSPSNSPSPSPSPDGVDMVGISDSTGILALFSRRGSSLRVFSASGRPLAQRVLAEPITCMIMVRELQTPDRQRLESGVSRTHEDFLVTGGADGRVSVRGPLPQLGAAHRFTLQAPVHSIASQTGLLRARGDDSTGTAAQRTSQFLVAGLADGKLVLIRPRPAVFRAKKKLGKKKKKKTKTTQSSPPPPHHHQSLDVPSYSNSWRRSSGSSGMEEIPSLEEMAQEEWIGRCCEFDPGRACFRLFVGPAPRRPDLFEALAVACKEAGFEIENETDKASPSAAVKHLISNFRCGEDEEFRVEVVAELGETSDSSGRVRRVLRLSGKTVSSSLLGFEDEMRDDDAHMDGEQPRSRWAGLRQRAAGIKQRASGVGLSVTTRVRSLGNKPDDPHTSNAELDAIMQTLGFAASRAFVARDMLDPLERTATSEIG